VRGKVPLLGVVVVVCAVVAAGWDVALGVGAGAGGGVVAC
jgi:hypothetical protein